MGFIILTNPIKARNMKLLERFKISFLETKLKSTWFKVKNIFLLK